MFDYKFKKQQETGINTMGGVNVDFGGMMAKVLVKLYKVILLIQENYPLKMKKD